MKRGFTLIEMLIVVALIATLMTIVFRLGAVGSDESKRNDTVIRLAKLENCLSGYYAAYGCYPPVPLHNSRSIYEGVNDFGIQNLTKGGSGNRKLSDPELWNWNVKKFQEDVKNRSYDLNDSSTQSAEKSAWKQVKAACESQPVALEAPDPEIDGLSQAFKELTDFLKLRGSVSGSNPDYAKWEAGFGTFYDNIGSVEDDPYWREAQICKFGLLSFLLPRFQAMMGWPEDAMFNGDGGCKFDQWNAHNGNAPHDPMKGGVASWKDINKQVLEMNGSTGAGSSGACEARAYLEALPSEAVTARWMPNLEGLCVCDYVDGSGARKFMGVNVADSRYSHGLFVTDGGTYLPPLSTYSSQGSLRNCYHLNRITVLDGWRTEFFYYSAPPYQSYHLWSAGKNKRTFPPWISRQNLDTKALQCVTAWTEDDIRGMSN